MSKKKYSLNWEGAILAVRRRMPSTEELKNELA